MSTWHQDQARTKLYHQTDWTVVSNPPNQMRTLSTFSTEAAARVALAKWKEAGQEYLYLLPPANYRNF